VAIDLKKNIYMYLEIKTCLDTDYRRTFITQTDIFQKGRSNIPYIINEPLQLIEITFLYIIK